MTVRSKRGGQLIGGVPTERFIRLAHTEAENVTVRVRHQRRKIRVRHGILAVDITAAHRPAMFQIPGRAQFITKAAFQLKGMAAVPALVVFSVTVLSVFQSVQSMSNSRFHFGVGPEGITPNHDILREPETSRRPSGSFIGVNKGTRCVSGCALEIHPGRTPVTEAEGMFRQRLPENAHVETDDAIVIPGEMEMVPRHREGHADPASHCRN